MRLSMLAIITIGLICLKGLLSFPSNFVDDKYCSLPLEPGTMIMGKAVENSVDRKVIVKLNNVVIQNLTTIDDLSEITLNLDPPSIQSVLELRSTDNVKFVDGGCNGKRIKRSGKLQTVQLETNHVVVITVTGCWASSYSGGVKMSEPFVFYLSPPFSTTAAEIQSEL